MSLLSPLLLDMVSHDMGALLAGGGIRVDKVEGLALLGDIVGDTFLAFELEVLEVFASAPWRDNMLGLQKGERSESSVTNAGDEIQRDGHVAQRPPRSEQDQPIDTCLRT